MHYYHLHWCSYSWLTAAKSLQSCPTLCDPIDGSLSGSPVPGILQARTLEWVAISFSNAWKWKGKVQLLSRVWPSVTPWTAAFPGPSIHGIFQARVLEWGAIAFSDSWLRWGFLISMMCITAKPPIHPGLACLVPLLHGPKPWTGCRSTETVPPTVLMSRVVFTWLGD